jgi:hypothetical protein
MKALRRPPDRGLLREAALAFWSEAAANLPEPSPWLEAAALRHQAALLLARVDGKSPAEYLREPATQQRVRALARALILHPPSSISHLFEHV